MFKAMQFQRVKNAERQQKTAGKTKSWKRPLARCGKKAMETLYNNLRRELKSDIASAWVSYIEKHEILESVNEY